MKNRRNIFLLSGVILSLLAVSFIIKSASFGAQDPGAQDPKADIRHQRREARYNVDPYLYYKTQETIGWRNRRDGDFNITHIHRVETKDLNDPAVVASLKEKELTERRKHICAADVILKGEVVKAQGVITDDNLFIYTVYTFAITDIMRARPGIALNPDGTVNFTAPGGTAIVEGADGKKTVTFNYPHLDHLKVNAQYILYLARDEDADDYYVRNRYGVFILEGDKLTRMDARMDSLYQNRHRILDVPAAMPALSNAVQSTDCR
jgi:hypothetical protein